MTSYKKNIRLFCFSTLAFTCLIALLNYTIDPFQQYRKSTFYEAPYIYPRYLNAGMAKNFSYGSVILGSSTSENFRLSEVASLLSYPDPIKLTVGGSSIFDDTTQLNTAIATGKVKKVLYGLDIICLKADPDRYPLPSYLYDQDTINDYHYLFNFDTLKRALTYPLFQFAFKHHPRMDYNRMFEWQHNVSDKQFNRANVLHDYKLQQRRFSLNFSAEFSSYTSMKQHVDHLLLPIIEHNKAIHFDIFFPPYSVLEYKLLANNNQLNTDLAIKMYISKQLLKLSNVSLFDFQTATSITSQLDNYMDLRHYHQRINHWMLTQIQEANFKVENPRLNDAILRKQVKKFTSPLQ